MRRSAAAVLTLLVAASVGRSTRAQNVAPCERSLDAIHAALDDDARRTRTWTWAWMGIGSALLAGQGTAAALTTGNLQRELAVGAFASAFVPGILLLHPPRVLSDARVLDERLALTTVDGKVGDPCIALGRAREILDRDADDESLEGSWFNHAFVIGGNLFLGLVLGIGFHDWAGFVKQSVAGSVVGELQILTFPGGALKARPLALAATW